MAPARQTLTDRTVAAAQWRFATAVVRGVLQFGVGVLLARLLPPQDFGLIALAMVFIGLVELSSDLGLRVALIQFREITPRLLRVSFTVVLLAGLVLAVALFLLAPFAALLTQNEAVPALVRLLALVPVFGSLGLTALALLHRALDFKRLFLIETTTYTLGYAVVAAGMALNGFGVLSLVGGALAYRLLMSGLAMWIARPPLKPLLARVELKQLLGFGLGVSLANLFNYAARNGDTFIVGRWIGTEGLGWYGRAYSIMILPVNYIGFTLSTVLLPAYSRLQEEPERLRRAYLLSVQLATLVTAPLMAGLIIAAPHFIVGLYGTRWAGSVLPLQILCAAGLFRIVYHLAGAIIRSTGHVYADTRRQFLYVLLVVGGSLGGLTAGIAGVAAGVGGAILIMYLAMSQLCLRIIGCSWRAFAMAQAPGVVLGILTGAVALGLRLVLEHSLFSNLTIFIAIGAACAVVLPLGLYLLPRPLRPVELFGLLGNWAAQLPRPLRVPLHWILRHLN